jgi:C1A family cysteine protease
MNYKGFVFAASLTALCILIAFSPAKSASEGFYDFQGTAEFYTFVSQFGKSYSSQIEHIYRQSVFISNLRRVKEHNAKFGITYLLGINEFSDLSYSEKAKAFLSSHYSIHADDKCQKSNFVPYSDLNLNNDNEIDWSKEDKVHAPKHQGRCASGWAFATIGAVESAFAIFNKTKIFNISEQELIDCSDHYGNFGCDGGIISRAFNYIMDHKINSEETYPYLGEDYDCNGKTAGNGAFNIKACVQTVPNVEGLTKAIRSQPVSVAFNVQEDFFDYASGIYNPQTCGDLPNHSVLAIGFNLNNSPSYYIAKNSWGTNWGESGFFRIAIGEVKGTCNFAGSGLNYYPVV